ncbi:hypothetical protein [Neobacillus sp. NPDC093127]|uniref:hypothetical protein n=1 Tax=Neobacillus sp. NPDC093127 TaxID=3364296 RepID=UPI00381DB055
MKDKIAVSDKIKVFVSSRCGVERYDRVRSRLKYLIEETGLAEVYLFEDGLASTQTAAQDYLYSLDDSDVCIFLIDNEDGVTPAILKEINRAKAYPKKSLYLFCNEKQKEPTQIQKELVGAQGARYYITKSFDDFIIKGYESLINDICKIYNNYCKNRLVDQEFGENKEVEIEVDSIASESLEKRILSGTNRTKLFISGQIYSNAINEMIETNDFDAYCEDFLQVLFGGKSIREFNTSMFMDVLKKEQSENLHKVVKNRWKAIQYYWNDDLENCIECLEVALSKAKEFSLPNWIIQDILIDLRNTVNLSGYKNNEIIIESDAQKELNHETKALFYPLIDRYDKELQEEITKQTISSSTKSPYTFSWSNHINIYSDLLTKIYVISVFNGSLTHILMTMDRLKYVAFNLCNEYSDWQFRVLLLKVAIRNGKKEEIKGYIKLFNDVFGKMNSSDSLEIFKFCNSIPINHKRDIAKLEALKNLGYYLSDSDYEVVHNELIILIENWIADDYRIVAVGSYLFEALRENSHRFDKNIIIKLCLDIIIKKLYRFYDDALEIIAYIGLKDINEELSKKTIDEINRLIVDKSIREECNNLAKAIIAIRKSKKEYTSVLHRNVLEHMTNFNLEIYTIETMVDTQEDSEEQILKYIFELKERNRTQGINGSYTGYANNLYQTIKNIIKLNNIELHGELVNSILEASLETVLSRKQLISDKIDAIKMIIFVKQNCDVGNINFNYYIKEIRNNKELVIDGYRDPFFKKTNTSLQFNLVMLKLVFEDLDINLLFDILGSYGELDEFEKIEALKAVISTFENDICNKIDKRFLFMLMQFVLSLSHNKNHDIRFYSIKALLLMITEDTKTTILTQLSKRMDYDSVFIKNHIMNQFDRLLNIDLKVTNLMIQKASVDNHYVIRKRGLDFLEKMMLE